MKYALCFGINDYPGTGSDLSGCVNDANDWKSALTKRGFQTRLITDKQATRKNMLAEMKEVIQNAKRGDSIVLTYSGHGTFIPDADGDEPDGTDECLVPYDIRTKGPITDDELFELFSSKASGVRLVFLSDSCHSGTVARFAPITTPPTLSSGGTIPRRIVRFLPPSVFLSKSKISKLGTSRALRRASPPGRYGGLLMSGCLDAEYSYDAWFNGRANGAFTFVALRALKSLKANATYRDWYNSIRQTLPSQQYPQTPNLFGSSSMKRWRVFE
jgi:hypothetical protein